MGGLGARRLRWSLLPLQDQPACGGARREFQDEEATTPPVVADLPPVPQAELGRVGRSLLRRVPGPDLPGGCFRGGTSSVSSRKSPCFSPRKKVAFINRQPSTNGGSKRTACHR